MQFRKDRKGNDLSILGFGCMRFPQKMGKTDMEKTRQQILEAINQGVNYFDTAYVYPGSEAALGAILQESGLRDKVYIASKLPHYLIKSRDGLEKLFQQQLARLRTDHIDYYLMHMLTDVDTWDRLRHLGVDSWLREKQAQGQIGQVGFSYHGNARMFCQLTDAWDWDFVQIQYNYLDENSQAGRRGLMHAHEKGLPVIIMEPLRGGRLVKNLPAEVKDIFSSHTPRRTPAQWALGWLWDQPQVTCVLSGMNSMDMVRDNIETACRTLPGSFTPEDQAMIARVVAQLNSGAQIGCTGCGYCMPCPKNVDIPGAFAAYNRRGTEGKFWALADYAICTALRKNPTSASNCIGCGKCESHCPQQIPIRAQLKKVADTFEGAPYRLAKKIAQKLLPF